MPLSRNVQETNSPRHAEHAHCQSSIPRLWLENVGSFFYGPFVSGRGDVKCNIMTHFNVRQKIGPVMETRSYESFVPRCFPGRQSTPLNTSDMIGIQYWMHYIHWKHAASDKIGGRVTFNCLYVHDKLPQVTPVQAALCPCEPWVPVGAEGSAALCSLSLS